MMAGAIEQEEDKADGSKIIQEYAACGLVNETLVAPCIREIELITRLVVIKYTCSSLFSSEGGHTKWVL